MTEVMALIFALGYAIMTRQDPFMFALMELGLIIIFSAIFPSMRKERVLTFFIFIVLGVMLLQ